MCRPSRPKGKKDSVMMVAVAVGRSSCRLCLCLDVHIPTAHRHEIKLLDLVQRRSACRGMMPMATIQSEESSDEGGGRTIIMDRFLPAAKALASLPFTADDSEDEFSFKACGFWSWRLKNATSAQSPLCARNQWECPHPRRPCKVSDSNMEEEDLYDPPASSARRKWREGRSKHGKREKRKSSLNGHSGGRGYSTGFADASSSPRIGDALMKRISYSEGWAQSRSPLSTGISPYRNEAPASPFRGEKGFLGFPAGRGDNKRSAHEEKKESDGVKEGCGGHNSSYEGVRAPPLPQSPSQSWLSRAMPLVISFNSRLSPARAYGKSIQIQRESFQDSFDDAKWETV